MTPEALRHLRESRDWTREEMAQNLGGITASSIVKWERGERPIPQWVIEKLLRTVEITFSVADIQRLVDHALATNQDFEAILAAAVREYLAQQRATAPNIAQLPTAVDTVRDAVQLVAETIVPYAPTEKRQTS